MPLRLRIEGFVGPAPPVTALANWTVDVGGNQYALTVTKLQPSADVAFWHVLNALEPLPIAMTIFGDRAVLRRLTETPPGQAVVMDGSFELRRGSASLLLRSVEVLGTPVPLPSATKGSGTPAAQ